MDYPYTDRTPQDCRNQNALLVASLLHLMSHYSARTRQDEPCLKLAAVIERHLIALARVPDVDPVLRASCEQLSETWGELVDVRLPAPSRRTIFARFMNIDGKGSSALPGTPA